MFAPDGKVCTGAAGIMNMGKGYMPIMFTTPKNELLGCRETAWLGCFLNISPVYDVWGPDAVKLLNYVCVNRDFAKLKVGGSRHAILCDEKGRMLADGVLMRKEENLYRTYWLAPVISYYVDTLGMDVHGKWVLDEFFFQIDGPRSLEIMEKVSRCDLHNLKFAQHKNIRIADTDVTIHRLGMSGCLAYEMHGDRSKAEDVYDAIAQAGEEFGIRRLGFVNYCRNHTQAGYPNQWIHYWYPWFDDEKLGEYVKNCPYVNPMHKAGYHFLGSAADNPQNAFVTPFDVKWEYLINYDHDFIGKAALEQLKKNPPRTAVTLEWDAGDVGKVFASQFMGKDTEPCDEIVSTGDGGEAPFFMSKVLADGKMIGMTAGRSRDYYHRRMISLAFIDKAYAVEGKELTVIWGTNPATAMEVRATVAPFPYYNEEYRNETFDVEKIPHPVF